MIHWELYEWQCHSWSSCRTERKNLPATTTTQWQNDSEPKMIKIWLTLLYGKSVDHFNFCLLYAECSHTHIPGFFFFSTNNNSWSYPPESIMNAWVFKHTFFFCNNRSITCDDERRTKRIWNRIVVFRVEASKEQTNNSKSFALYARAHFRRQKCWWCAQAIVRTQ